MAVRDLRVEPLAAPAPAPERRHVGLRPRFVDEDQALGIEARLQMAPTDATAGDIGAVLLTGEQAFLNVLSACRINFQTDT